MGGQVLPAEGKAVKMPFCKGLSTNDCTTPFNPQRAKKLCRPIRNKTKCTAFSEFTSPEAPRAPFFQIMPENETTEEQAPKGIGERFREEGVAGVFRKRSASNKTDPNEMHFLEHLEELRWVIFKSLIAFIVGCIGVAVFMGDAIDVLQRPLVSAVDDFGEIDIDLRIIGLDQYVEPLHEKEVDLGMLRRADDATLTSWGIVDPHHRTRILTHFNSGQNRHLLQVIRSYSPIFIAMKICFLGGLGVSLPFIFYFVGSFVVPGLTPKEKAVFFPGCFVAFLLFLAGAAMTYFVILPFSLAFTIEFTFEVLGLDTYRPEAGNYYSTVIWMTFAVGVAFQFPLILLLLIWIGVLSVEKLRGSRRMVFVILMVSAALITPGGDPVSLSILTIPLYVLYELAILVGGVIERKKKRKEWEEWDEDLQGPRPPKPKGGKTVNKPLLLVILAATAGISWYVYENQDVVAEWIDAARDFGKFGGASDNGQQQSAPISKPSSPMASDKTEAKSSASATLSPGSLLRLQIPASALSELNASDVNGSILIDAELLKVISSPLTNPEANGSR